MSLGVQGPNDWPAVAAALDGRAMPPRHAVLTFSGTWAPPGVGYASDTVNGLNTFVNDQLCYEVPVIAPWSFGPLPPGSPTAPSYQESVRIAVDWASNWIRSHPGQTFALGGYSQGAEAASRVAMELMDGALAPYFPEFIGGYTYGNPCRGEGFHAPTIADPGGRGISATRMRELPTRDGRVIWADYVHSPANGDMGLDMYASVPDNQVGTDMTDVYDIATRVQLHDLGALTTDIVHGLTKAAHDLFPPPTKAQTANADAWFTLLGDGLAALSGNDPAALAALLPDLADVWNTTDWTAEPTGLSAALDAAIAGIRFLAAPGGPTAPHISYLGEIGGYTNLVAHGVGFLNDLAIAVPARTAA